MIRKNGSLRFWITKVGAEMFLPMGMNLMNVPLIGARDIKRLKAYDWPENVREVQNIVERALILSYGDRLTFPDLSTGVAEKTPQNRKSAQPDLRSLDDAMSVHIQNVIDHTDWKVVGKGGAAAEVPKMDPDTLRFRMKKLGIKTRRQRAQNR